MNAGLLTQAPEGQTWIGHTRTKTTAGYFLQLKFRKKFSDTLLCNSIGKTMQAGKEQ